MNYQQAKPLVDELEKLAILYHGSRLLRGKIYEAIDAFLPDMDEACLERGCTAVDDFRPKENT